MKNITLLFFAFFYATSSVAQLLECPITLNSNDIQPPMSIFNNSVQNSNSIDQYVFNVKFHIVKNDDGSGVTASYGENEVMNAIMIMNTNFNQFNIFFKYNGYDVIPNTSFMKVRAANFPNTNLSHPTFDQLLEYSKTGMTNPVYDYNAMNLFIVEGLDYNALSPFNAMLAGAAKMPGIDSIYGHNHFLSSTLPHEIAHNFFLLHTHEQYGTPQCERVANPEDDFNNSATNGDRVIDTKASFMFGGNYVNLSTCTFQNPNGYADCLGTPYVNVPVKNYMTSMNPCQNLEANYLPGTGEFTPGQGNVMRNTIALYYNHPNNFYGLSNAKNTIESLYQPFDSQTVLGDVTSVSDNEPGDGMANVCRGIEGINYRFQKGFTYNFSNIYNGTLISSNSVLEIPSITASFIQGVQINEVHPTTIEEFGPSCTKEIICQLEPYIKGKIITTYMIGSTIYTIEELDQIKVKDPDLYDKLMSQTYNIVIKETASGAVNEKVIYKN